MNKSIHLLLSLVFIGVFVFTSGFVGTCEATDQHSQTRKAISQYPMLL